MEYEAVDTKGQGRGCLQHHPRRSADAIPSAQGRNRVAHGISRGDQNIDEFIFDRLAICTNREPDESDAIESLDPVHIILTVQALDQMIQQRPALFLARLLLSFRVYNGSMSPPISSIDQRPDESLDSLHRSCHLVTCEFEQRLRRCVLGEHSHTAVLMRS